jgi:hypothetical protein
MRPVSRRVLSIFCTFASLARAQIGETMITELPVPRDFADVVVAGQWTRYRKPASAAL